MAEKFITVEYIDGEQIIRDMTDEEISALKELRLQGEALQQAEADKLAKRTALFEALAANSGMTIAEVETALS